MSNSRQIVSQGNEKRGEMMEESKASLLLVDDDPSIITAFAELLRGDGYFVHTAMDVAEAVRVMRNYAIDVVLTDIRMPGGSGMELLEKVRTQDPDIPVILMTGYADLDTTLAAIKREAFDFITKPLDYDQLVRAMEKAVNYRRFKVLDKQYKNLLENTVMQKTKELYRKVEELNKAKEAALESSRLKSEFLAGISHQLRMPLNSVTGMIGLVLDTELTPEQRKYLESAKRSAGDVLELLDSILDFSKK